MRGLGLAMLLAVSTLMAGESMQPLPYRDYGWFIGDVLTRCWRVAEPGKVLPPELPHSLNRWLTVIRVHRQGNRLCIDYQVDYAPFTTETVTIPAWNLTLRQHDGEKPLTLASWRLTLAPLRPIQSLKGELFLQPERLPPPEAAPLRQRFWIALGLIGLGLGGLSWYWLWGRREVNWPFCRAWIRMAGFEDDEAGRLQAYLCLHRALDSYRGGSWWGRLDDMLARYPGWGSLADELKAFAASSAGLFFAAGAAEAPWPLERLRRLARRLALEELRRGGLVR
ncbi:mxaA protein [Methylomarinovum tepidoasis]|uniref:MxaA protein n=2 Tax=Methylomarinovum tepidoasis TaxID=2840183 RepID=A0AAU9CIS2_9GAMM|nr:mxaA protein [Methylomarinovum sp. IN45]